MNRRVRNILTAYLLFLYGIVILPVLLINFKSAAYEVDLILVIGFSVATVILLSLLFYNWKLEIHYPAKIFMYWSLLTLINFFIWIIFCDGTFILRD